MIFFFCLKKINQDSLWDREHGQRKDINSCCHHLFFFNFQNVTKKSGEAVGNSSEKRQDIDVKLKDKLFSDRQSGP